MTPSPPIQFSSERHKRMPGGRESSPTMTVDPVVVSAEVDSKMASATVRSIDEAISGTAPMITVVAQRRLTIRKPKRAFGMTLEPCVARAVASDSPPVKKADSAKTCQSGLR